MTHVMTRHDKNHKLHFMVFDDGWFVFLMPGQECTRKHRFLLPRVPAAIARPHNTALLRSTGLGLDWAWCEIPSGCETRSEDGPSLGYVEGSLVALIFIWCKSRPQR